MNVLMFIPTVALGAIGGLFGALFNTIILKATAFRGIYLSICSIYTRITNGNKGEKKDKGHETMKEIIRSQL